MMPFPRRFKIAVCGLAALPFLLSALATAPAQEDEQKQLRDIERQIEQSKSRQQDLRKKAEQVAKDAKALSENLVAVAAGIQEQEQALTELETKMQALEGEIGAKRESIQRQSSNMAHTLGALERLSQRPPQYILMRPAKAVDTVRSASLLTAVLPEIEKRAGGLKKDLADLAALKDGLATERQEHRTALAALKTQYASVESMQREKRALYADYLQGVESEQAKARRLASEAKDLRSLIERLEKEMQSSTSQVLPTPPIPPGSSFAKVKGRLPYPARGKITQRFGDKIPAGTAKGINIQAVSGAVVIAPFDGRIIYAGPFRTYGQLLIIAHGDGYHSLLAGLGRIDVMVGQWVLAGEPVGAMPDTRVASSNENSSPPRPEFYFEIRKNGEPVNPLPWLGK